MSSSKEGDNIEFTAVDKDDYTIWFAKDQDDEADDATTKHPKAGNNTSAYKFAIRVDKNADLIGIDEVTFTNPCQITADKAHVETSDVFRASKIVIRTNSTNTLIKVRWF